MVQLGLSSLNYQKSSQKRKSPLTRAFYNLAEWTGHSAQTP
jgi:hypothetical protein